MIRLPLIGIALSNDQHLAFLKNLEVCSAKEENSIGFLHRLRPVDGQL
jgi:mannitol/fructose-specific phosphotransferase system IIA component